MCWLQRRNAVEVREAVQFLTGEYRNPRLFDVTMALWVMLTSALAKDDAGGAVAGGAA